MEEEGLPFRERAPTHGPEEEDIIRIDDDDDDDDDVMIVEVTRMW